MIALALGSAAACARPLLTLLVIHSYSQEYPWTRGQHDAFVATLSARYPGDVMIETEYLDTKRRHLTPEYVDSLLAYLGDKYRDFSPSALYVTDDSAFEFATRHLAGRFPETPLFFSGVNDLSVLQRINHGRITGIIENKKIAPNLDLLQQMNHHNGDMVVIGDDSDTYRAIEREIRKELTHRPAAHARFISSNRIDILLDELSRHPESDVFLTTLGEVRNREGRLLPLHETLSRIANSGDRLVVSMEDGYVIDGVLGGYVTSSHRQGEAAAGLLMSYLDTGVLPAPSTDSPNEYLIDYLQLDKHGLALPPSIREAATLLHPPESFYQRHHTAILTTLYASLLLLLVSGASFLFILARKNRLIELRSSELKRQASLALQAKESLDEAQQLARQGSWEWNVQSGEFRRSEGLEHLYGMFTENVSDERQAFLRGPDDERRKTLATILDEVSLSGRNRVCLHQLRSRRGETRYLQETIRLVNDADGRPERLIGTVQDITEQHLAQSLLRENEEKYRRLFEMSEDPMVLIMDRRIVMANHAAARALGFENEASLMAREPEQLMPARQPDGAPSSLKAAEMIRLALERGYHRFEWEYLRRDGSRVLVEASLTRIPYEGKPALYGIWRDIMEIKRIQAALRDKSTYLDGILSSSERVAIIATDPEGNIQYYNLTAEKLFGIPSEQAVGLNLLQIHRRQGVEETNEIVTVAH